MGVRIVNSKSDRSCVVTIYDSNISALENKVVRFKSLEINEVQDLGRGTDFKDGIAYRVYEIKNLSEYDRMLITLLFA